MKIIIEGRPEHLHALREACEHYFRIALGQFREVAKEHLERLDSKGGTWWDVATEVERMLKPILTPDLSSMGSSYGVGNPKLSQQSHICYELWKLFGGGTDGPPPNYSGVALPRVTFTRTGE